MVLKEAKKLIYNGIEHVKAIYGGAVVWMAKVLTLITGQFPLTLEKSTGEELVDYKIYGESVQGILPEGYTELEYLESTGTQYIDTGVLAKSGMKLFSKFQSTNIYATRIIGASINTFRFSLLTSTNDGYLVNQYGSTNNILSEYTLDTNIHTLENDDGVLSYDGNVINTVTKEEFTLGINFYLFASNTTPTAMSFVKIYSCKIYDHDVPVRDFIPCIRKSDNKPGMYDLVEGKFYGNVGTGEFIAGATLPNPQASIEIESVGDKALLPYGYTQLEYIQSTGTQYIDTGIVPTVGNETEIIVDITRTSSASGSMGANNNLNLVPNLDYWRINAVTTTRANITGEFVTILLKQTSRGRYFKIDNIEGYGSTAESKYSFHLFKINNGEAPTSTYFLGKIKKCLIKEKNILVRNYIPAKRNSDNVVGLYDLVTNTFKTNAGTGNFVAGDVVEQGGYKIPVKVSGKNLFKGIMGGHKYRRYNTGSILTEGDYEGTDFIEVKPNTTYTLSFTPQPSYSGSYWWAYTKYDEDKKYLSHTGVYVSSNKKLDLNIGSNVKYISICFYKSSGLNFSDFGDVQLEEDSEATSYEPYFEPYTENIYLNEPLRKIGDYSDYIDFKEKKVVRNVCKQIDISNKPAMSSGRYLCSAEKDGISKSSQVTIALSNLLQDGSIYTYAELQNVYNYVGMYKNIAGESRIVISKISGASTIEEVQNVLKDIEIYYPLATPIEETIDLPPILTQEGTNIISIDTKIQPSNGEIKYWKG